MVALLRLLSSSWRGPARGQPGRDSILRSTRADAPTALHRGSGTPRLLDAPVTGLRVAPRIVRIYTLRGFESVLAGSVQPGLLGDELA